MLITNKNIDYFFLIYNDILELLFKYPTSESNEIEKSLHNLFKYYRIINNGEWFKFEDEKISEWLRTDFQDFVSQL